MTSRSLKTNFDQLLRLLPEGEFLTVTDVGSMGGTEPEWQEIETHPRVRCVGFEPDSREFNKLKPDSRHVYFNYALGQHAHVPMEFYVSHESGKSSVLAPNIELIDQFPFSQRYHTRERVQLESSKVSTLDTLAQTAALTADFLKLDTQGSEKAILEGGRQLLASTTLGVKVEVEFLELYKGQPLFADVDTLLRSCGFELMDLRRVYWKKTTNIAKQGKGQLVFGDALYLKSISSLFHKELPRTQILKFLTICLVYGCFDPAMDILKRLKSEMPGFEGLDLIQSVFTNTLNELNRFRIPGSRSLSRGLLRVLKFLTRSDQGFSDADSMLGNRWLY